MLTNCLTCILCSYYLGYIAGDPTDAELDEGELCFMEDVVDLLEASHFRLLSDEDWQTAQAEEFTVFHSSTAPPGSLWPCCVVQAFPAWSSTAALHDASAVRCYHSPVPAPPAQQGACSSRQP